MSHDIGKRIEKHVLSDPLFPKQDNAYTWLNMWFLENMRRPFIKNCLRFKIGINEVVEFVAWLEDDVVSGLT